MKVLGELMHLYLLDPEIVYESALALDVSAEHAESVFDLRRKLAVETDTEQMDPHVTVLFLGRMPAARLLSLHQAFSVFAQRQVSATVADLATFRLPDGSMNLHVRLDAPEVNELHVDALDLCLSEGWTPQTDYVRNRYTPHLTIYDRVDLADVPVEAAGWRPPSDEVALSRPHLMVRQVLSL